MKFVTLTKADTIGSFTINADLIQHMHRVESYSNSRTQVVLTTGADLCVAEKPADIVKLIEGERPANAAAETIAKRANEVIAEANGQLHAKTVTISTMRAAINEKQAEIERLHRICADLWDCLNEEGVAMAVARGIEDRDWSN